MCGCVSTVIIVVMISRYGKQHAIFKQVVSVGSKKIGLVLFISTIVRVIPDKHPKVSRRIAPKIEKSIAHIRLIRADIRATIPE